MEHVTQGTAVSSSAPPKRRSSYRFSDCSAISSGTSSECSARDLRWQQILEDCTCDINRLLEGDLKEVHELRLKICEAERELASSSLDPDAARRLTELQAALVAAKTVSRARQAEDLAMADQAQYLEHRASVHQRQLCFPSLFQHMQRYFARTPSVATRKVM